MKKILTLFLLSVFCFVCGLDAQELTVDVTQTYQIDTVLQETDSTWYGVEIYVRSWRYSKEEIEKLKSSLEIAVSDLQNQQSHLSKKKTQLERVLERNVEGDVIEKRSVPAVPKTEATTTAEKKPQKKPKKKS